jgi:uncharacterized membrane protein YhaH (DUF805 family)
MSKFEKTFKNIKGRISRGTFWLFFAPILILFLMTDAFIAPKDPKAAFLIAILLMIPGVCLYIKRAHDRNKSGWFTLLMLVPIVSFWPLIELWCIKGTNGPNRYGDLEH